jgi:phenylalanyl-tRNA synthetase alpha chain
LEGLPEQKVLAAAKGGKPLSALPPAERSIGLAWASKNGWVRMEGGELRLLAEPSGDYPLQSALLSILKGGSADEGVLEPLRRRKLVSISSSKAIFLEPTAMQPEAQGAPQAINTLTREMLLSGSWEGAIFREYDVSKPAEMPQMAKRHIISRLKRKISRIFADMGFEEMKGPELQSSFWNFDALFQPQDHPARDLADTFYVKGASPLPSDQALVMRVKKIHEKYWGGRWDEENAQKTVLRTHTTAVSASYLYNYCRNKLPKKYFSIGKVFRNEATDYKHLAEFFQVEGIVVWEGATFRDLLGCLKEFYRKLGFEKIRFQPSYFPYTEPSLEISVYFEKKQQWLELGGAGIFRPEVSIPLCDRYPVLAWGLSLERPLMLLSDTEDIRDFYRSNAGWLRRQKLLR